MVRKFHYRPGGVSDKRDRGYARTGQPVDAGPVEIAAVPGGGMFFMKFSNGTEPKFGNYTLGTYNRWIGIEGDQVWRWVCDKGIGPCH